MELTASPQYRDEHKLKTAVSFANICMAYIETQILNKTSLETTIDDRT